MLPYNPTGSFNVLEEFSASIFREILKMEEAVVSGAVTQKTTV
jgi:hypothetical protein